MAMGGQAEAIADVLRDRHRRDMPLGRRRWQLAVEALGSVGGEGGAPRTLGADQLEVAVLDRARVGRTFRRIVGAALTTLLAQSAGKATATDGGGHGRGGPGRGGPDADATATDALRRTRPRRPRPPGRPAPTRAARRRRAAGRQGRPHDEPGRAVSLT